MDRPAPPVIDDAADERTLLMQFLDYYRAALLDRAWGLDADQLRQRRSPSRLSLAGLIGHMAYVEYVWFAVRLDGEPMPEPFSSLDFDADWDAEMTMAETWTVERLVAEFDAAVADARRRIVASESLDRRQQGQVRDGEAMKSLRWMLIHMIEEYARHCGHADLLREAIDGDCAS